MLIGSAAVSGSLVFRLLLLHVVFVMSGNAALLLQKVAAFLLSLHSDWLSGLEKKEASIFEMALTSFVILEINL